MALEADVSFSRHGVVGRMIGLDDLRGLFQPMVLWLGSKEEAEAKPRCFASKTQDLFQKPLLEAARLLLLQTGSIFGHSGEAPAKDAS